MSLYGVLFMAAGGFTLACVVGDVDWFFNSRKAQTFVRLVGRTGARAFYGLLGLFLLGLGLASVLGLVRLER